MNSGFGAAIVGTRRLRRPRTHTALHGEVRCLACNPVVPTNSCPMLAAAGEALSHLAEALAARYRIERELGRGGMANVYLARDLKHDREVAIKVLRPEHTATIAASRFLHEIRLAASLDHPNVVSLYDSGEAAGLLYYVMPYVRGESLRQRLQRERQLPVAEALRIAREIAAGLTHAHACGVVHRDIKPENILLSQGRALLADFGIARAAAEAGSGALTSSGTFVGTPLYASPEQVGGTQPVDARSDLYSLGCVVYEMLAGEPPFTAPTPQAILAKHALEPRPSVRTVRDTVPGAVDEALRRAMARVPADRFVSVAEFSSALETAPATRLSPSPDEPVSRGRWLLRAGGPVVVLAVAAFAWLVTREPANGPMPAWDVWSDISGEDVEVAATDSLLLVHPFDGYLRAYGGAGWSALPLPPSLIIRSFEGQLPASRLLAAGRSRRGSEAGPGYSWFEVGSSGLREVERLPAFPLDHPLIRGWTDGVRTVVWSDAIERLEAGRWVRENRPAGGVIRRIWGPDLSRRFALVTAAPDSLLVFDSSGWRLVDILPERSTRRPDYSFGTSLRDGTSLVLGLTCDSIACEPIIVEQDTSGTAWHRLPIPDDVGIPRRQPRHYPGQCEPSRFAFSAAAGRSRDDYYVWGTWIRCDQAPAWRTFEACPPGWPCVWHVSRGRIQPVDALRGKLVHAVLMVGAVPFALGWDGQLWKLVDGTWRVLEPVPGLPARRVAASGALLVHARSDLIVYHPGANDSTVKSATTVLLGAASSHGGTRAVAVRDSTVAALLGDGTILRAACTSRERDAGSDTIYRICEPVERVGGPANVLAIALLPDALVLGVGPGLAVSWDGERLTREDLPGAVERDSLWGVSVDSHGTATVIGRHTLAQRDPRGNWTIQRLWPRGKPASGSFAVLPNGEIALASDGWLRVWPRAGTTSERAVLAKPWPGEPGVSAVHVLPDGALVAGYAYDGAPGGGAIEVWQPPVRPGRSERILLPIGVAVTSLADDGRTLIVAGRGGSVSIPLASLPFANRELPK